MSTTTTTTTFFLSMEYREPCIKTNRQINTHIYTYKSVHANIFLIFSIFTAHSLLFFLLYVAYVSSHNNVDKLKHFSYTAIQSQVNKTLNSWRKAKKSRNAGGDGVAFIAQSHSRASGKVHGCYWFCFLAFSRSRSLILWQKSKCEINLMSDWIVENEYTKQLNGLPSILQVSDGWFLLLLSVFWRANIIYTIFVISENMCVSIYIYIYFSFSVSILQNFACCCDAYIHVPSICRKPHHNTRACAIVLTWGRLVEVWMEKQVWKWTHMLLIASHPQRLKSQFNMIPYTHVLSSQFIRLYGNMYT